MSLMTRQHNTYILQSNKILCAKILETRTHGFFIVRASSRLHREKHAERAIK